MVISWADSKEAFFFLFGATQEFHVLVVATNFEDPHDILKKSLKNGGELCSYVSLGNAERFIEFWLMLQVWSLFLGSIYVG